MLEVCVFWIAVSPLVCLALAGLQPGAWKQLVKSPQRAFNRAEHVCSCLMHIQLMLDAALEETDVRNYFSFPQAIQKTYLRESAGGGSSSRAAPPVRPVHVFISAASAVTPPPPRLMVPGICCQMRLRDRNRETD